MKRLLVFVGIALAVFVCCRTAAAQQELYYPVVQTAGAGPEVAGDAACGCGCGEAGCDACCGPIRHWLFGNGCSPRWTAQLDMIAWQRDGARSRTLITNDVTRGVLLDATDMHFGTDVGPRVSLIHHGDGCNDLEFVYFGIDGWDTSRTISTSDTTSFTAPGFRATIVGVPSQFTATSKLYNGEINVRHEVNECTTALIGFRWIELRERLTGGTITQNAFTPFWDTKTDNHLYGMQVGLERELWNNCNGLRLDGNVKLGIFGNHADQTSALPASLLSVSATSNHTAFVGEIGLIATYEYSCRVAFRGGYNLMWIDGVALPSAQIDRSNVAGEPATATADARGGTFYQGLMGGLEVKF